MAVPDRLRTIGELRPVILGVVAMIALGAVLAVIGIFLGGDIFYSLNGL